jgi:hypothetical protein
MASAQAADTDGDGRTDETFSASYIVHDDGTAEGFVYLDSDYRIDIESGRIEVGENGELIVTVNGANAQHELGHILGFRHEHTRPTPTGGGQDIIVFDIIDSVTGRSTTFQALVQLTVR